MIISQQTNLLRIIMQNIMNKVMVHYKGGGG